MLLVIGILKDIESIIENMAQQILLQWNGLSRLEVYLRGARLFIECGPKGFNRTDFNNSERKKVLLCTLITPSGESVHRSDALAQLLGLDDETPNSVTAMASRKMLYNNRLSTYANITRTKTNPIQTKPVVVCTGASLGLPGGSKVYAPDKIQSILRGDNRLTPVSNRVKNLLLMKEIVRLHKNPETGQGDFIPVDNVDDCIQLAGQAQGFDFNKEYDADPSWSKTLAITSKLAIAAGIEVLRDAGIPLIEEPVQLDGSRTNCWIALLPNPTKRHWRNLCVSICRTYQLH